MKTLSRRSVLRTAAWSTPVVLVGVTAPAYATSNNPKPELEVKMKGRRDCFETKVYDKKKKKWVRVTLWNYRLEAQSNYEIQTVVIGGKKAHYSVPLRRWVLLGVEDLRSNPAVSLVTTHGTVTHAVHFS